MAVLVHQFIKLILPLLFVVVFLQLPSIQASDFMFCDNEGNYPVTVYGVVVSPDPIELGISVIFLMSASTNETISSGKLVIDLFYFWPIWVPIYRQTHDLCAQTHPGCPIPTGYFTLHLYQHLPLAPLGTFNLEMKLVDENGHQLTCIDFYFFF